MSSCNAIASYDSTMQKLLGCLMSVALLAATGGAAHAPRPLNIVVFGGSGHIGQRIVHEALERGHHVTVVVRAPAEFTEQHAGLHVLQGNVLDAAGVARTIAGQDVVVNAVAFRKPAPDPGAYRRAGEILVTAMRQLGSKAALLIVVGGAGSLERSPGVLVADSIPAAFRAEVLGQKDALDYYRTVSDVRWTYFSPAESIVPGTRTGKFRLGGDQLVADSHGVSRISMEDYAIAVLDEAEKPAHLHKRFTIGY